MTEANFPRCLDAVFKAEGIFSNDPGDPGGATKYGITRATLARWRGHPVTVADVMAMEMDEARAIYRAYYWIVVRAGELPSGVDLVVFDVAVNSGPGRAVKMMQRAVAVTADGIFGPMTMRAIAAMPAANIVIALDGIRRKFYRGLVARDPSQSRFIKGWLNRVDATTKLARDMLGK